VANSGGVDGKTWQFGSVCLFRGAKNVHGRMHHSEHVDLIRFDVVDDPVCPLDDFPDLVNVESCAM
jgi:hypothetical protein